MSKNRMALGGRSSPGITGVVKLEKGSKADTERARQSNGASPATHTVLTGAHVLRFPATIKTLGPGTYRERLGCFRELSLVRKKEKHV